MLMIINNASNGFSFTANLQVVSSNQIIPVFVGFVSLGRHILQPYISVAVSSEPAQLYPAYGQKSYIHLHWAYLGYIIDWENNKD